MSARSWARWCYKLLSNITFELGARTFWHIHQASKGGGQILFCIVGRGWFQEEGKDVVSLEPGTVITIQSGVKHWHGAKADSWFSHISEEIPGENLKNEWLEPVSDEAYGKLTKGVTAEEMTEIITHAAFYAGWPNAWAVFPLAKEVYREDSPTEKKVEE